MNFRGYFFQEEVQDKELFVAIEKEFKRQQTQIELIASENFVSKAVMAAMGLISDEVRAPLCRLSNEKKPSLLYAAAECGIYIK